MIDLLLSTILIGSPTDLPNVLDQIGLHKNDFIAEYRFHGVDRPADKKHRVPRNIYIPTSEHYQSAVTNTQKYSNYDAPITPEGYGILIPRPDPTPVSQPFIKI